MVVLHRWIVSVAFLVAASVPGCSDGGVEAPPADAVVEPTPPPMLSPEPPDARAVAPAAASPVVLVTFDGARWQEIFRGADLTLARAKRAVVAPATAAELLPNLHRLLRERGTALGACGEVRASGPNFVSLPGYMELLTANRAPGCDSNLCGHVALPTLAGDARLLADRSEVAVIASWELLERAARRPEDDLVISVGRHGGDHADPAFTGDPELGARLAAGARAPRFPGENDYRPDAFTAPIALRYLAARQPLFLHLGLGDADEHGHRDDYPSYLAALRYADGVIGDLDRTLEEMGPRGARTTVVVTADHGRSDGFRDHGSAYPESATSFVAVLGGRASRRGVACADRPVTLADVGQTLRWYLDLAPSAGPDAGEIVPELVDQALVSEARTL